MIESKKKELIPLINRLFQDLFPICRSLTGNGNRETLRILNDIVPLNIEEIPSGTTCYDWVVPDEWNINDAWIKDEFGNKIVDFKKNNLHILNYSIPVHKKITFNELQKHLYTLPNMPESIPYRTTYYEKKWGFCLDYNSYKNLNLNSEYEVYIDSNLNENGSLTYADSFKAGKSSKEFIISSYFCHPSLANDNLSGVILSTILFSLLKKIDTYYSYRLILVPETIGAIAYLSKKESSMKKVREGFVVSTIAGPGKFGYKKSFLGDSDVDIATQYALSGLDYISYNFKPDGSDERQFSSPGFRIPIVTITKDKYYEYPEYHTSKDNLEFISPNNLFESLKIYFKAIQMLEKNRIYKRIQDKCEYHLSKYHLYPQTGGIQQQPGELGNKLHKNYIYSENTESVNSGDEIDALSWLMFACDGKKSLFEISQKYSQDFNLLSKMAEKMLRENLLTIVE